MIDAVSGVKSSSTIYSIAENAKANNLKPYEYFEYLLSEIQEHMDDTDKNFLEDLLSWSGELPERIRKPLKFFYLAAFSGLCYQGYALWSVYF